MSRFKDDLFSVWCDKLIIVCIGSSEVIGDSIGPRIGTLLSEDKDFKVPVIGTLDKNIGASKIDTVRNILSKNKYIDYYIICIDATISDLYAEGTHHFRKTPLEPGIGLNKNLGTLGNSSIKAIVLNTDNLHNTVNTRALLSKVNEDLITRMSNRIASDIKEVYIKYLEYKKENKLERVN